MDASTFPISFSYHLAFCLIAGIFFVVQFVRLRHPYQLLLAIGIFASLLVHVGDVHNKAWFHTIGVFEVVILLGAIVLSVMAHRKAKKARQADEPETPTDSDTGGETV